HGGIKFLFGISVLMMLLSALSRYEQHYIANRQDVRTVEGPVIGHWTRWARRGGESNSYWDYEGFWIQDVAFSYTRNLEQNYFHNSGSRSLKLQDGLLLRIRYLQEPGKVVRNNIV